MQFSPPFLGAGSEHSLRLNWTPGPQVALQGLQELQSDQPPSTEVLESQSDSLYDVSESLTGKCLIKYTSTDPGLECPDSHPDAILFSLIILLTKLRAINAPALDLISALQIYIFGERVINWGLSPVVAGIIKIAELSTRPQCKCRYL